MALRVVTDSTTYLPAVDLERLHIDVVPLFVNDGDSASAETDLDFVAFYHRFEDTRVLPTSSQPSLEALVSAFRRGVEAGDEVLGVFLSGCMSGTFESAQFAATMVRAEIPDARIEVLDSESNCMQEGYAVLSAAEAGAAGSAIEECLVAARATMARSRFVFTPRTLEYLRRGGRIGNASALLGTLLRILPVLTVDGGLTTTDAKVRTHAKALERMRDDFARDVAEKGLRRVVVHSIAEASDAEVFARDAIEPIAGCRVDVIPIGPVIGMHVGPAVGLVYETEEPLRIL